MSRVGGVWGLEECGGCTAVELGRVYLRGKEIQ